MLTRVTLRLATLAIIGFAILGVTATVQADLILRTPAGLTPGETFRFVFVTDDITTAQSSNISTYDAFVQADAGGATYNGAVVNWQAIGSTSTVNAITHIRTIPGISGVYLPDGTLVTQSDGLTGLWGAATTNLNHAVDETINGVQISAQPWTGTQSNGTGIGIQDGVLGGINILYGFTEDQGGGWVDHTPFFRNPIMPYPMYGISEVLTVVPEPSTGILAGIGSAIALLLAAVRNRKERRRQRPVGPLDAIQ
jgi:PEP-CTERM motif